MDLETINNEYKVLQNELAQIKKENSALKARLDYLKDERAIAIGAEAVFRRKGNIDGANQAKADAERIKKEIIEIKRKASEKVEALKQIQATIDEKLNELKQNPEMKAYIDKVLEERYSKKIEKLNTKREREIETSNKRKQKEIEILNSKRAREVKQIENEKRPLTEKRDKIYIIQELLAKNPQILYILEKLIGAGLQERGVGKEFEKILNPESIAAHDLKRKATERKKIYIEDLEELLAENDIDITVEELLESLGTLKVKDQEITWDRDTKGKVDVTSTINKNLKGIEDEIARKDKAIEDRNASIDKRIDIKVKEIEKSRDESLDGIDKLIEINTMVLKKSESKKIKEEPTKISNIQEGVKRQTLGIVNGIRLKNEEEKAEIKKRKAEEKEYIKKEKEERGIKPYNFFRRFAFWRERRKTPLIQPPVENSNSENQNNTEKNTFLDSLKFDIVRDIINREDANRLKSATKEVERKSKEDR